MWEQDKALREFKLPVMGTPFTTLGRSSLPVSDIEFSSSGKMLIAERYHIGAFSSAPTFYGNLYGTHSTRVLEFTGASGAWIMSPHDKFRLGHAPPFLTNSAGGIGVSCNGSVWASGDSLAPFQFNHAYGLMRINGTGNQTLPGPNSQSHLIDLDGVGNYYSKTLIGDVDVAAPPPRVRATLLSVVCPTVPNTPYQVTLSVQNLLPVTLTQISFAACPVGAIPAGAMPVVPLPAAQTVSIAAGASGNITIPVLSTPIGGMKCFCIQGNPADFPVGGYPPECVS